MTAPQRLRIGIVGAGRRGRQHAATILELGHLYDLVAVCDLKESAAGELAAWISETAGASRPAPRAHWRLNELFSQEKLDAVVITTPPDSHHLVARAAAAAGVHMLVETPLAPTRAMMDTIATAADAAGVHVEVGENYGRRPAERVNRTARETGALGDLLQLSAFNAPANHGTVYHMVSLFRLYAGSDVEEVSATDFEKRVDGESGTLETWTTAIMTFANGVTASLEYVSSWASPRRWGRPRIVTLDGSDGYINSSDGRHTLHRRMDTEFADYQLTAEGPAETPDRWLYPAPESIVHVNPFAGVVRFEGSGVADGIARAGQLLALHGAVTSGGPSECGIADARRSQEIGIALAESGRLRRRLSARLQEETTWEREQHEAFRRLWGADPIADQDSLLARFNGS